MSASYSSIPPTPVLGQGAKIAGRFTIQRAFPAGSFGQTYEATDDRTGKRTALRLIPAAQVRDKEDAERVRTAVKAAAGLIHRNIVGTYGIGQEPSGDMFLTMEYVDGQHLRALLERRVAANKRFSLRGAFNIVAHVCHGLTHAQSKSVVHGSLSPYHVFVGRTGRVKVAGFALSRILPSLHGLSADMRTYLLGYMAPEARGARGAKLDARSDVFSVAVMLFELLGGKPRPGIVPSAAALPESVPPGVRKVIETALGHAPEQRPASAAEFEKRLSAELQRLGEIEPADDDLRLDVEVDLGPPPEGQPANEPSIPPQPPALTPVRIPAAPPRVPGGSAPRLPAVPAAVDISVAPAAAGGGAAGAMLRAAAATSRGSQPPGRGR
ncbi:MAG: serine/threonine protein kinase, partial [Deltaproteobacteria bacterium]|nr:serine/threonine protein kinase [Deltaproteobacteria bacterium]